jgi:hypothetical protein
MFFILQKTLNPSGPWFMEKPKQNNTTVAAREFTPKRRE